MAVEAAAVLTFAAVTAGSGIAVTAVTGDAIVSQVGAVIAAALTFAGVLIATRRKRTEPAAPPAKTPDVVTIPRRRYDELVRAEERDRMHAEEQAMLRELREDR